MTEAQAGARDGEVQPARAHDLERLVRDLTRRWDHRSQEMEDLLDRLCGSLAERANHELRQILTVVLTELELASLRSQGPGARLDAHTLDQLLDALDRGTRVAETLLNRRRIAKLLIHLDREPVDLESLLVNLLALEGHDDEGDRLELATEPVTVRADREKLVRVLRHLVGVVEGARAPGGRLRIEVEPRGDQAAGHLGCRPSQVDRQALVEKLDGTLDIEEIGIDVPYARAVIERHGGKLFVDRREPGLLGYAFELPRAGPPG